ncbi:MAG: class I poly(R)-hydroxyalkanoic acid synthase, partial [Variovorax sp.]
MKQQAATADAFASMQQALTQGWSKALESFQSAGMGGVSTPGMSMDLPQFSLEPEKLQALQQQYVEEASELWRQGFSKPTAADKRFAAEAWGSNPVSAFSAAVYLLNARTLMGMADAVEADPKTKARLRFAVEQWMAASAPSNSLAFNAEAQKRAIETQGESIAKGLQNLLKDVQQGHLSMTDESAFEVGRNVATT